MVSNALIGTAIVVAMIALPLTATWIRMKRHTFCESCHFPAYRCDCPKPCEHEYGETFWTADGWVRVCRRCKAWDYLGDSYLL